MHGVTPRLHRPHRGARARPGRSLDAADAPGARAALDVELALVLDAEPEIVLGLPAGVERAREGCLPAVQVAGEHEALGPDLAQRHVVAGRVLEAPGRRQLR